MSSWIGSSPMYFSASSRTIGIRSLIFFAPRCRRSRPMYRPYGPSNARAARREDRRLPLDRDHRPATQILCDDAGARPAVDDEARDEVLVEPMDAVVLHRRLEERVEDVEADLVRGIHGPLHGHASERALAHAAVLVAGPRATPVLEADDFLRAPGHEELDRVLVGEEVGSLDRVQGVELEGIVIAEHGRGPTLRGHRMTPHGIDLRDEGDRQLRIRSRGGDGGAN